MLIHVLRFCGDLSRQGKGRWSVGALSEIKFVADTKEVKNK